MYDEPAIASNELGTLELYETEPEVEKVARLEEKVEPPQATSECTHYLGYLSEKSSKEQIPDECIMCKDIVTCMLKKMKE